MVDIVTPADTPDGDDEPGVQDPINSLRQDYIIDAAVEEDPMPNRLSKIDIDRNICTIPHARYHLVAWMSRTEVDITSVARTLETTRKEY